ncbi:MAG TPA: integrin alpha [Planctomycetota bacterium]|nr:integrin alpha [Planctomycetota bacterium]
MGAGLGPIAGETGGQTLLWQFSGQAGSFLSHQAIASVGDADGDGVPDLLVGSPFASPAGVPNAGQARLLSGASGAVIQTVNGTTYNGFLGISVAGPGDLDGDAAPDCVAGSQSGFVQAFSGATGSSLWVAAGPGGLFGFSVARGGDVNGDAVPDVFVGAPGANPINFFLGQAAGAASVISGSNGTTILTIAGSPPGDLLGWSVAGPGDLDGDGVPDLVAGARQAPGGYPDSNSPFGPGAAKAFSCATGALLWQANGTGWGSLFGTSVAAVGDIDADGVSELLVGVPLGAGALPGGPFGRARALSGASGAFLFDLVGSPWGNRFGSSVAGSGDVDGDGIPDLLVGAPLSPSLIPQSGTATLFSGAGASPLYDLIGRDVDDAFGASVAGVGDLNGDGVGEVAIAAPGATATVEVFSPVGPIGLRWFGNGCSWLSSGAPVVPSIGAIGGLPTAGNGAFAIWVSGAQGAMAARLLTGASSSSWLGIPLPLDLGTFGLPGCFLYASPDAIRVTGTGVGFFDYGTGSVPVPIPAAPALVGVLVHFQWSLPVPAPGRVTGGLSVRVL